MEGETHQGRNKQEDEFDPKWPECFMWVAQWERSSQRGFDIFWESLKASDTEHSADASVPPGHNGEATTIEKRDALLSSTIYPTSHWTKNRPVSNWLGTKIMKHHECERLNFANDMKRILMNVLCSDKTFLFFKWTWFLFKGLAKSK